jgi:hypothetical protein
MKVFSNADYLHQDGMLTKVWGPSLWHTLHTISFNYPVNPTTEQKHQYRNFILGLQNILPCKYCRINLAKNFKEMPLTMERMESRQSFSFYVYQLHEKVNKLLKKKSGLTYCQVRERYEHFRARCLKKTAKGCTEPLVGKKAKCLIRIVPDTYKACTFKINRNCLKSKSRKIAQNRRRN